MKGSLQRGPACRGPSQTQGWLLGQIPGGWGQRPHCSPDPQTPPNALGIRSLSFRSSVPYRPQLFATGSSPGPSSRRVWGAGVRELPVPHPHHTPNPFGQPGCGGSLGLTSEPVVQASHRPSATKPFLACSGLPASPTRQNHAHPSRPPPGSLSGLPLLRGAS